MGRPRVNEKPRDGRPGFVIRLEPDIVEKLRQRAGPAAPGRGGGIAHYLRCLVFNDLGLPAPAAYADRPGARALDRQRVRLVPSQQGWVKTESTRRGVTAGDLVEALIQSECARAQRRPVTWDLAWEWVATEAIRAGLTTDRFIHEILRRQGAPD